jgi:hypothetical protein
VVGGALVGLACVYASTCAMWQTLLGGCTTWGGWGGWGRRGVEALPQGDGAHMCVTCVLTAS